MQKLRYSEVICPICLSILIEPVTLPCNHEMCLVCFQESIHSSNIACPMCRLRISSWSRRAAREKSLINTDRWKEIKIAFPREVEKRLSGEDDSDVSFKDTSDPVPLSKPGEIRKEYEERLLEFQLQEALMREQEEKASNELIKQIQNEELQNLPKHDTQISPVTQVNDHLVPSNSLRSIDECNSSSAVTLGKHTGKRKPRSSSADSCDSIKPELQYFKPIKTAPKTPPKRRADGQLIEAPVMCIKPRKLFCNSMLYATDSMCNVMSGKLDSMLNSTDGKVGAENTVFLNKNCRKSFKQDNQPLHTLSLNSPKLLRHNRSRRGFSVCCEAKGVGSKNLSLPVKENKTFHDDHSENNNRSEDVNHHNKTKLNCRLLKSNKEREMDGSSKVRSENRCFAASRNQQNCSVSKVMQKNSVGMKSQVPSCCTCENTKSVLIKTRKRGRPSKGNVDQRKLLYCVKCKGTSFALSSDSSDFTDASECKLSLRSQVEKDYALAVRLQKRYDHEVKKPSSHDVKSDYNLRKRHKKV